MGQSNEVITNALVCESILGKETAWVSEEANQIYIKACL